MSSSELTKPVLLLEYVCNSVGFFSFCNILKIHLASFCFEVPFEIIMIVIIIFVKHSS